MVSDMNYGWRLPRIVEKFCQQGVIDFRSWGNAEDEMDQEIDTSIEEDPDSEGQMEMEERFPVPKKFQGVF